FQPPAGVKFDYIPPNESIGSMLVSGEIDATLLYLSGNNLVDRSRVKIEDHPEIKLLFPDPVQEGIRYYQKTGIMPINHCIVIRRSLVEKYPWLVLNIYKGFKAAKEIELRRLNEWTETHFQLGWL